MKLEIFIKADFNDADYCSNSFTINAKELPFWEKFAKDLKRLGRYNWEEFEEKWESLGYTEREYNKISDEIPYAPVDPAEIHTIVNIHYIPKQKKKRLL